MSLSKPPRRVPSSRSQTLAAKSSPSSTRAVFVPHHRVTKFPLAVSVTVFLALVAVIVGALAASSMRRDDDMLRHRLEETQQQLLSRLENLEEICLMPSMKVATTPTPSTNLSVTVTAKQLNEMRVNVDAGTWNMSTSTEAVEYRDTQRGVRFTVPYNPKWGNEMYKATPFEIEDIENNRSIIHFGPILRQTTSGYYYRQYQVIIAPSTQSVIQNSEGVTARARRLGGFEVTSNTTANGEGSLIFQGKKYTYILNEIRSKTEDQGLMYQAVPMSDTTTLSILRTLRSI